MATLTTALIRDAKPRAKTYELTCSGLPGFLLRVLPTGKKVFLVRHRIDGRDHRTRLGLWSPALTVEEARRRAAVLLGGGDLDVPANPPATPDERRRLQAVLEAGLRLRPGARGRIEPMTVWALQLLALTGLRRDEILDLKWSMVDWQHALFNLPDTKTGQRSVRVSSPVIEVLREIRQHAGCTRNGYVITSRTGGRLKSLNRSWERIRVAAGIPDVRLHDLRHSFASDAIMGGVPLAVVGKLLGHRQARTTERYAHIADKVVHDAVEHTAARIADTLKPALVAPPAPPPFKALTNTQWAKVAPIVCAGRSLRAQAPLRKVVDGIRWVLHHNTAWREIPREYGSYTSCWRWHARWQADGTWAQVAAALG